MVEKGIHRKGSMEERRGRTEVEGDALLHRCFDAYSGLLSDEPENAATIAGLITMATKVRPMRMSCMGSSPLRCRRLYLRAHLPLDVAALGCVFSIALVLNPGIVGVNGCHSKVVASASLFRPYLSGGERNLALLGSHRAFGVAALLDSD
jgi:hypothetical protein